MEEFHLNEELIFWVISSLVMWFPRFLYSCRDIAAAVWDSRQGRGHTYPLEKEIDEIIVFGMRRNGVHDGEGVMSAHGW